MPERFGKGAVEGVIGPEAANNSKEGGSLLPTPGSRGALDHLDLVWILIWTLVIAKVLAAIMFFAIGAGWRS